MLSIKQFNSKKKQIEKTNLNDSDKAFLTNWLKGGLNGPDELCKQEILLQQPATTTIKE